MFDADGECVAWAVFTSADCKHKFLQPGCIFPGEMVHYSSRWYAKATEHLLQTVNINYYLPLKKSFPVK